MYTNENVFEQIDLVDKFLKFITSIINTNRKTSYMVPLLQITLQLVLSWKCLEDTATAYVLADQTVGNAIKVVNLFTSNITLIALIILGNKNHQDLILILTKIDEFDRCLFNSMHIKFDSKGEVQKKFNNFIIRYSIIGGYAIFKVVLVSITLKYFRFITIIDYWCKVVIPGVIFQDLLVLTMIEGRYKFLNDFIKSIDKRLFYEGGHFKSDEPLYNWKSAEYTLSVDVKLEDVSAARRKLQTARVLYANLHTICEICNNSFMNSYYYHTYAMFFEVLNRVFAVFLLLISSTYYKRDLIVNIADCLLGYNLLIPSLCNMCYLIDTESRNTGDIVQEIYLKSTWGITLKKEIRQFVHEIKNCKLDFTSFGFFILNRQFLLVVCILLINYKRSVSTRLLNRQQTVRQINCDTNACAQNTKDLVWPPFFFIQFADVTIRTPCWNRL